jgi:hypothetical protein
MQQETVNPSLQPTNIQDNFLFVLGRRELSATRTYVLSAVWTSFGLLILLIPYLFDGVKPIWQNLSSVVGTFIIASAGIGTLNFLYLRQAQIDETRGALKESLVPFENSIRSVILSNIAWINNINESGLKKISDGMPREEIGKAIRTANQGSIRYLFLSHATINHEESAFYEAVKNGCSIQIIVADPIDNCVIKFSESTESYKNNHEQVYAGICIDNIKRIKNKLPEEHKKKFIIKTYSCIPSIVVVQVINRFWFGILWNHQESFIGPWFEIEG